MKGAPTVVGVDGTRAGWIAVTAVDGTLRDIRLHTRFADLLDATPAARVIAVDIPIGLLDDAEREADRAARRALGKKGVSVFPTAPRAAYEATGYDAACRVSAARIGKRLSRQAWNLGGKILEVDGFSDDPRLHEVHPELSFQALAGEPLRWSKKTWGGLQERIALLDEVGLLPSASVPDGVARAAPDDVLDAVVCAWSATRIAQGRAWVYPERPGQRDPRSGRSVRIQA